jgi:hypothetical protein
MRGGIAGRRELRDEPGEAGRAVARPRRWSSRRLLFRRSLAGLAILLAACSGDPSQQIDDLASSAASARLVAADRLAGAVPRPYARRLLADLAGEVTKGAESLKPGSLTPDVAAPALATARELRAVLRDERRALEAGDRDGLRAAMQRAGSVAGRLRALSKRASAARP